MRASKQMMYWVLLAIVVVALISLACAVPRFRGNTSAQTTAPFVPNPHNDKVIFVQGWDESEVRKIITDFVKIYENDGYPPYSIEPYKQHDQSFRLQFPNDIHPLLFTFLVNYIAYPFDLYPTNRPIVVAATSTLTRGYEGLDESLISRNALLYVPENDQDHTIVYIHFSDGTTYANSSHDLVWQRVTDPRLSPAIIKLAGST